MRNKRQMNDQRVESLDVLKGVALILIIFFHSSIYNYANIHKIDFSNPPIIVVVMSFMALWGGIFIICSMTVNALMTLKRMESGKDFIIFSNLMITGVILIFFHYILNIFMGRWNNDFVNNKLDMTVVAGSLRNGHLTFPLITKFFEGSPLSTIALNLIALSLVLFLMIRGNGLKKENRNHFILGFSGFLIMILSFVRVSLFPLLTQSIESHNYLLASLFGFVFANPYPILPYLAYGIFGLMIGLMIYQNRRGLLKKVIIPTGIFFFVFGLIGMLNFEKTISKPDYFWYFKTNFELGLFLLLLTFTYLVIEPRISILGRLSVVKWFSRISLSVYMLETLTSEILRIILFKLAPSWNQTINGCLMFGGLNVVFWIALLFLWRKIDFKYSLEYFWVLFSAKTGKISTKMDCLP